MCDADDNVFTIGRLMVQMHGHPAATKTENISTSSIHHDLSVDEIEPSFLTGTEENSSKESSIPRLVKEDFESYYAQSSIEESYNFRPSPPCQNYIPYYGESTNDFCSSTPFHNAVPYVYSHSSGTSTEQVYFQNDRNPEVPLHSDPDYFRNEISHVKSGSSDIKPFLPSVQKNGIEFIDSNNQLIREDSGFDEKRVEETNQNFDQIFEPHDNDKINFIDVTNHCVNDSSSHDLTKNTIENCSAQKNVIYDNDNFIKFENEYNPERNSSYCSSDLYDQSSNVNDDLSNPDEAKNDNECIENSKLFGERNSLEAHEESTKASMGSPFNSVHSQFSKCMLKSQFICKNFELYNCSECNYSSYNKSNFKNHLFIHSEKRRFACPYCSYKGKQSAGLRAHMKVHSIEKPFLCSICNYRCKRKQNLVQHLRIHSKNRPFLCRYCDYGSTTKKSLQNHMMKHCEEPDDVLEEMCKVKEFEDQDLTNLVDKKEAEVNFTLPHSISSSNENITLNCMYCDFSTKRKCALQNHVKIHKGSENEFILNNDDESEEKLNSRLSDYNINDPVNESSKYKVNTDSDIVPQETKIRSNEQEKLKNMCIDNEAIISNGFNKYRLQCPYCTYECDKINDLKSHINSHSDGDFIYFTRNSNWLTDCKSDHEIPCKNNKLMYKEFGESDDVCDDVKHEIEHERNEERMEGVEHHHENIFQKRRQNSLHYLKWNFYRNKSSQRLKDCKLSEIMARSGNSLVNDKQKLGLQTSKSFSTALEKQSPRKLNPDKADRICQSDSLQKETSLDENGNQNISNDTLLVSMNIERQKNEVKVEKEKGPSVSWENKNLANKKVQQTDILYEFSSNSIEVNKTSEHLGNVSVNDNHEFCGFSNESIEKCNEFTSTFLSKFDPLHVVSPQLSNSTPRTDAEFYQGKFMETDSFDFSSKNNDTKNGLNLSTRGDFEQQCKSNEIKNSSISDSQINVSHKDEISNIIKINDSKNFISNKNKGLINHFKNVNAESEITNDIISNMPRNFNKNLKKREEKKIEHAAKKQYKAEIALLSCSDISKESDDKKSPVIERRRNVSKIFRCNICDAIFERKSSLVNHVRSHTRDSFQCPKCPITFKYRRAMQDHEKAHFKEKTFKCSKCSFSSMRKCSLMSHFRCHRKKFKCMHCNFKCSLIKKMEKHYLKHKNVRDDAHCSSRTRKSTNEQNTE